MGRMKIKVGVVSDVVCPWCYIGKRRLEKAMTSLSDRFVFDVEFFPFELNPHMPEEGLDNHEYLCRKFGGESKFESLTRHVSEIASKEGIDFNLSLQQTAPNTRNIHRIIMLAREEGIQMELAEAFFRAYFTEGADLSKIQNLIDIAGQAGIDRDRVAMLLHSNTGKLEIEMAEKELQDLGITSVPLFIIDNQIALSGAQPTGEFVKAFESIENNMTSAQHRPTIL